MNFKKLKKIEDLSLENLLDEDSEFIPLIANENEKEEGRIPDRIPILPLRNLVLFPGVVTNITVGRDSSIELVKKVNKSDKKILGVVVQKKKDIEEPSEEDIYKVGVVARILKTFKMPNGDTTIILQGRKRFHIQKVVQEEPYIEADIVPFEEKKFIYNEKFRELMRILKEIALKVFKEKPNLPSEASFALKNINSDSFLVNFINSNMGLSIEKEQKFLEEPCLKKRAGNTLEELYKELQRLELRKDIQNKTREDMDRQQREYYLHQQMKTIQEELGSVVSNDKELAEFKKLGQRKKWKKEVKAYFEKELSRLERMSPQMPEYSITRNHIELLLELPWGKYSKDKFDLKNAQKILDTHHYGLEDVKKRIIEHLAVLKLRGDMKSPIICLHGPPGVGKTSLGKSIAESLGRKYARMSLGGLRDESEIRGHRKTYIGAMPGRLIQNLKKVKTSNPVFVLDEIDKLVQSVHGDPSAAMLEVLDPEQNTNFHDNYLEVGYDLSKILFIATANNLSEIPWALQDRMELVNVTGYTIEEKIEIAKKHLLVKQLKAHGLHEKEIKLNDASLEKIITGYTRESGVRNLEKQIAKIVRFIAKSKVMEEPYEIDISLKAVEKILGPAKMEKDKYENNAVLGIVTGLAWTAVGGDILFIESTTCKGKGNLSITGNIGKVMKESATIALEYIKSNAEIFKINSDIFEKINIHMHVPEGATPKDGPSAGITMVVSLLSILTKRKVKSKIAMTGEITLRGKVLPVGGIKEKILAAKRSGIKEIILCKKNKVDVLEIKKEYLTGLKFHYVETIKEVVELALV